MMKPVYISSACAISPQDSFDAENILTEIQSSHTGKLFVKEPDYRQFIHPVAIRRMSRLIKMGIACGMKALQLAQVQTPDAIITGTGLGSMTDMEKFLKDMILLKEEALNPTFFIQSTYNSVNGWISLQTKSTGYNQTYVHRGFSMEMALMDAQLFLNEQEEKKQVLAGGFDVLTDEYFLVKSKVGYWKKHFPDSKELLAYKDTDGTIGGEGAAFFVLTNEKENAVCVLHEIGMVQKPAKEQIKQEIEALLERHHLSFTDIDVVICGNAGDARFEPLYAGIEPLFSEKTTLAAFKHLTGEYPTATGFALWMATQILSRQHIPAAAIRRKGTSEKPNRILVVNHYLLHTASLVLLSQS